MKNYNLQIWNAVTIRIEINIIFLRYIRQRRNQCKYKLVFLVFTRTIWIKLSKRGMNFLLSVKYIKNFSSIINRRIAFIYQICSIVFKSFRENTATEFFTYNIVVMKQEKEIIFPRVKIHDKVYFSKKSFNGTICSDSFVNKMFECKKENNS